MIFFAGNLLSIMFYTGQLFQMFYTRYLFSIILYAGYLLS